MASIISGEMADCDWLRSAFSGPLFSRNVMDPATLGDACILKKTAKLHVMDL
jgi:hypothetical protein